MNRRLALLMIGVLLLVSTAIAESGQTSLLAEKYAETEKGAGSGQTAAAAVEPISIDPEKLDFSNGSYKVQIEEMEKITENQYLTLSLYLEDQYDPEQIRALAPGDTVWASGKLYTVKEIDVWDTKWTEDDPESLVYEIESEEENWEGLYFREGADGIFYADIGDWTAVTYVGTVKVPLPLSASFVYFDYPGGEDPLVGSEKELLSDLQESSPAFYSPYNTSVCFRNGELAELHNWSYPWGPDTSDSSEEW